MTDVVVQVPNSLLLSPDLPASAKLIWMVSRLWAASDHPGSAWLSETSGLSRPTVLTGIARLAAAGWEPARATNPAPASRAPAWAARGATVPVPGTLLTNRRLGIHPRVLYGLLLLTPGFRHPWGEFTYAQLAELAHASPTTVTLAVGKLVRAEWVKLEQANRQAPIQFELSFPGFARGMTALDRAQGHLARAEYLGEGLMREYLSLLIDSDDYEDDAAPGFLVNPRTDERLQLDRFYPPNVAFEFNGPQHYRATAMFSADVAAAQRERDFIKIGICATRGVALVVVHSEDLSLKGMQQEVGRLLPQRDLAGYGLLIDFLESESRDHRRRLARI